MKITLEGQKLRDLILTRAHEMEQDHRASMIAREKLDSLEPERPTAGFAEGVEVDATYRERFEEFEKVAQSLRRQEIRLQTDRLVQWMRTCAELFAAQPTVEVTAEDLITLGLYPAQTTDVPPRRLYNRPIITF